jgi:hypothetical protein
MVTCGTWYGMWQAYTPEATQMFGCPPFRLLSDADLELVSVAN